MKKLVIILFSLLLIAAQTLAVAAPVSSSAPVTKRSCCGGNCDCFVGKSAPSAPPVASVVPVAPQNQFVLPPTSIALFTTGAPADEAFTSACSTDFRTASLPLFQRNCVFLI